MKLYKYRKINDHTKLILAERDFWASTPDRLNDPFDCDPCFEAEATQDELRAHYESGLRELSPELSRTERACQIDRLMEENWPITEKGRNWFMEQYRERIRKTGIICFSEPWDSIVMWSHYAANHEGICVEVETNLLPPRPSISRVAYAKERPLVNLIKNRVNANRTTALSKNMEWSYEKEWRLVLEAKTDQPPCAVKFPLGFITGVILGGCIKPDDRTKVLQWCELVQPRPTIYEAFKDPRKYRIDRRVVER